MKILIACEESQVVCIEFRKLGHEAYSCDIEPCSGGHPEWHIQDDVLKHLNDGWDLMIAHPPCTYLSYVGNSWLNIEKYKEKARERYKKRDEAMVFFKKLWDAPINKICIENPRGYPMQYLKYTQKIHPYYFGDAESKTTLLWLKNLPLLQHEKENTLFNKKTHVKPKIKYFYAIGKPIYFNDAFPPSTNRSKLRSKTFPGIAKAMAEQWGGVNK